MSNELYLDNNRNVIYTINDYEYIDNISMNVLTENEGKNIEFLLNYSISEVDNKCNICFITDGYTSIKHIRKVGLSVTEYIQILSKIFEPICKVENWLLDENLLCFNPDYVFFDVNTNEIKYIYLPLKQKNDDNGNIKEFFWCIFENFEVEDDTLKNELIKFIALSKDDTQIYNFAENILEILNNKMSQPPKTNVDSIPKTPPTNSIKVPEVTNNIQTSESINVSNDFEIPIPNVQMDDIIYNKPTKKEKKSHSSKPKKEKSASNKSGLFKRLFGKKEKDNLSMLEQDLNFSQPFNIDEIINDAVDVNLLNNSQVNNNVINNNQKNNSYVMDDDSCTVIAEEFLDEAKADIILQKAYDCRFDNLPSLIEINFVNNNFTIGRNDAKRQVKQNDFEFTSDIKCVSRQQVTIVNEKGSEYVIDMGSTNGTYINGIKLQPMMKTKIKKGDTIEFSKKGVKYTVV